MSDFWITVTKRRQEPGLSGTVRTTTTAVFHRKFTAPVLVGRQDPARGDPDPQASGQSQGMVVPVKLNHSTDSAAKWDRKIQRLIIANSNETNCSRTALLCEPCPEGARLTNKSNAGALKIDGHVDLHVEQPWIAGHDVVVRVGDYHVQISPENESPEDFQSLNEVSIAPGRLRLEDRVGGLDATLLGQGSAITLLPWLETFTNVLEASAAGEDFLDRAASAAVSLLKLDQASVLMWRDGLWKQQVAKQVRAAQGSPRLPSNTLLERVRQDRKTSWKQPGNESTSMLGSLGAMDAAIASPILNASGEVEGALYGFRFANSEDQLFTMDDAQLMKLLAQFVAAGLAARQNVRLEQRFNQFFSPELAKELRDNPRMLDGRELDVTLLFCDIRKFSSIATRLPPEKLVEWLRNCMDQLSECVGANQGVIVDYIGDELVAMWGAPKAQPDHAALACRAAIAMLGQLPHLNAQWQEMLGEEMAFGIGINSGTAQVGNTGSSRRFKYGPLGSTVNLASRVQGVTKQLRRPILITSHTQSQLRGDEFAARRLCSVRVVNIDKPVDLYELAVTPNEDAHRLKTVYERALANYHERRFRDAANDLLESLRLAPEDGPSLVLLERTVPYLLDPSLAEPAENFDPVWDLKSK